MRDLTITLVQIDQAWENKKQNIALINDLLSSDFKTDLIILPEMFNTAFSMNAIELSEDIENSEGIQQLKNWARQKNAAIYTSLMIKEADKFYNRGCFVYPDGEICYYDKRKLFTLGGEELIFTAGSAIQIARAKNAMNNNNVVSTLSVQRRKTVIRGPAKLYVTPIDDGSQSA